MPDNSEAPKLSPLKQALLAIEDLQAKLDAAEAAQLEPIAIVGLACRFPGGADDPAAFWDLLRSGVDAVSDIPADRWDVNAFYDPDPNAPGKMSTMRGGFIRQRADEFDAAFFGIAPREAMSMDPQQRLLLEVSWEALENAGLAPDSLQNSATGVYIGVAGSDYWQLHLQTGDASRLDAYFASGVAHSVVSGRLSYILGLQGPSLSVDTACSSSLIAVHLAAQAVRHGECRMALAGGVNLILAPESYIAFTKYGMLSPSGMCKTFDAEADGFARGEGCGVIVLKRLSDALADGDRILALIRGTAANQDGPSSGLTAPNGPSQEAVIRSALANGGITPEQISYVETHGTGTSLGDPIEVKALGNVFGPGRPAARPLAIGAVKTNLGHLEAAAGIAGLIKAVLVLQQRAIPPHLHLRQPSPLIPWEKYPLTVPTHLTPLPDADGKFLAGVSAFGFSGTNVHVVLEAPPAPAPQTAEHPRPLHLLTVSAKNAGALDESVQRLRQHLSDNPALRLTEVAHTANVGRAQLNHRLAVMASDTADALAQLSAGPEAAGVWRGVLERADKPKVAFLFTGQGAQYVGMGLALYETQPLFRAALNQCDEILRPLLGQSLLSILYPTATPSASIDDTTYTQPALFAIEYALAQLWRAWGVEPTAVLGHSVGEFAAAAIAGVFSLEDGLKLIAARGRLMGALPAGGQMAAVFADTAQVEAALAPYAGRVSLAALNAPDNTVISGEGGAVQEIVAQLAAKGIKARALKVSHAFHSPLMLPMLDEFERVAAQAAYAQPQIRLLSNVTGEFAKAGQVTTARYWRDHVQKPVQFRRSLETLYREGYDLFLEIGPSPTLIGFGQRILAEAERPLMWAHSLKAGQDDWAQMLSALAALFTGGARVDWAAFDRGQAIAKISLPTYPFQRARYWLEPARPTRAPRRMAAHPLLGARLPVAKLTVFENEIAAADFSFLNDHRVFGRAILPATGFVEMLAAAARAHFGATAFQLEDVTIHAPLSMDDEASRRVQTALTPEGDGAVSIEVFSQSLTAEDWVRHASGLARQSAAHSAPVDLRAAQARCAQALSAADHYQRLAESGLPFGDSLKGVAQLWHSAGEALGQLRRTTAVETEAAHYELHPALLDAGLQSLAAALPATGAVYLPLNIERYQQFTPAAAVAWSHVRVLSGATAPGETVTADVSLLDESGQVVAFIEHITLKRAHPEAAAIEQAIYEVHWQPAPRAAPAPTVQSIALEPLAARLNPKFARLFEQHGLTEYVAELTPAFDRLVRIYVANALLKLGWRPQTGARFTCAALAQELKVLPQHQRLLNQLLDMLRADGFLAANGEAWEVRRVPAREDAPALYAALLQQHPAYSAELEITGRCGDALAEALTGAADPLQLLFPGGGLQTAERLYQHSPASHTYNGLMKAAVEEALAQWPADRPLRVLEIGGGTGGTSAYVLPALPAQRAHYTFTDISPLFTARAQQKFSAHSFVRYQPLDIEKDPAAQGLAGEQFDLILAANVIHATSDLRRTLRHVRQLLAPDGLFLMLEVTAPQRWVDVTFGLTTGWWLFSDSDLRPDYPLLSRPQWRALLRAEGFAEAVTVPGDDPAPAIEQAVIVARGPGAHAPGHWLVLADDDGVGEALAAQLRASGHSCALAFPGAAYEQDSTHTWRVNPARPEDYQQLLREVGPVQGVAQLWSLTAQTFERATGPALLLAQALAALNSPPRLWLVTRGAQSVGQSEVALMQAPVWGLGKVIALEHPELHCVRVDLDPAADSVAALLHELIAPDGEDEIALRGNDRLTARLTRAALPPSESARPESQQLIATQRGTLDGLQWQTVARRAPGAGEVEIRVRATALNFKDVLNTLGMYPGEAGPLGGECSGVIEAVGAGVTGWRVGDEVMALASGSFSTHVITSVEFLARKPAALSFEQAAAVAIPFVTAHFALNHVGQLQASERVLIHAGAGGVGLAAIQLAQRAGAEVFATAGSEEKRAYLKSLGVPHVMDSRSLAFTDEVRALTGGRGVNVILNSLAGDFVQASLAALAEGGRFVEIGKSGLLSPEQAAALGRGVSYHIIDWSEQARTQPALIGGMLRGLVAEVESGALQPLPCRAFPMAEAVDAFRFMQQAKHIGKLVVTQADSPTPIRSEGAYLVTGGLSGLGLLTAEWLVKHGARHIALMGRRAPAPEAQSAIAALRGAGAQVLVLQGDVAVEAEMRRALESIAQAMPPLRGVVHSAGALDDGALVNLDWPRFENVFAAKVHGARGLHQLTQAMPLDFFVMYSSVASVFGSRGQGNHAAANAYLDALAHQRRAQGLPALSINWGVWAEVGAAVERGVVERSAQQGVGLIAPEAGLRALEILLAAGRAQAIVSPMDWPRFLAAQSQTPAPLFRALAAQTARSSAPPPVASAPSGFLQELTQAPPERQRALLMTFVQTQAAKVLGQNPSAVSARAPLSSLGLDSLMAVEFRNLLSKALQLKRSLPVTLAFDYPTVEAVSGYLAAEVLALPGAAAAEEAAPVVDVKGDGMLDAIEDLSDEEVERRLAETLKGKA